LPIALYSLVQTPGGEAGAFRLCVIAVLVSLAALLISELLSRRLAKRLKG
jgi:molybdate transport system permease protein